MKKYLVLILFALIATAAFAQSKYQDVVYLKNGSVVRGVIIEQIPNQSIKIETADKNVFVYKMDEVEKIVKEPIKAKRGFSGNGSGLEKGYKGIVEAGYQLGVGEFALDRLKLNIINGYQINPYFSVGLGTGLRYYFDSNKVMVPIFADFRANFMNSSLSPYLSFGIGYSLDSDYHFEGTGMIVNPAAGVSYRISEKLVMNFGLGYEVQKSKLSSGDQTASSLGVLSLNIGISF
jgi:long-subunit fatty acid transport protein